MLDFVLEKLNNFIKSYSNNLHSKFESKNYRKKLLQKHKEKILKKSGKKSQSQENNNNSVENSSSSEEEIEISSDSDEGEKIKMGFQSEIMNYLQKFQHLTSYSKFFSGAAPIVDKLIEQLFYDTEWLSQSKVKKLQKNKDEENSEENSDSNSKKKKFGPSEASSVILSAWENISSQKGIDFVLKNWLQTERFRNGQLIFYGWKFYLKNLKHIFYQDTEKNKKNNRIHNAREDLLEIEKLIERMIKFSKEIYFDMKKNEKEQKTTISTKKLVWEVLEFPFNSNNNNLEAIISSFHLSLPVRPLGPFTSKEISEIIPPQYDLQIVFHNNSTSLEDKYIIFFAHKSLLAARSEYFRILFYQNWKEKNQSKLEVQKIKIEKKLNL